jgi:hypothetical protein
VVVLVTEKDRARGAVELVEEVPLKAPTSFCGSTRSGRRGCCKLGRKRQQERDFSYGDTDSVDVLSIGREHMCGTLGVRVEG